VVLLAATAVGVVVVQSGDLRLGLAFAAGAGAGLAILFLGVAGALRLLRRMPQGRLSFVWRHGIASLQRPGSSARPVALALGAGTLLLVLLLAVEATLLRPLQFEQMEGRGNLLLWDVQDDQEEGVASLLTARGHPPVQRAPIIPMRVAAVNGRPVGPAPAAGADTLPREERGPAGWAARREYRSTVRDTLVGSERLRGGRWWSAGASDEVSLEEGVAGELGVGVGDQVDWDVQGVRITTRVGSLREVEWTRFEPNFFAVFPPAALEGAPRTWIVLTRVEGEEARAAVQGEVVRRYPNVSVLDLTHLQGVVDRVLGRVTLAVRFLAAFTLAVGVVVLAAAAVASRRERVREGVLLRTIGATRAQLRGMLLAESFVLGAVGALVGGAAGAIGAWALARWLFNLPFVLPLLPAALTVLGVASLSALAGWGAARAASRGTALQALRDE
jgi:putative ABC transport system permease protein